MLFNVLLVILVAYAVFSPCFYIKFGMKIAEIDDNKAEIPIFNVPKPKKKPEMTRKDRQELQKWENLMRYDGTSAGQVKISEVK